MKGNLLVFVYLHSAVPQSTQLLRPQPNSTYIVSFYNKNTLLYLSVAVTSHPTNESELQLYRVLQRAKLLSYYDTFIAQGRTRLAPMDRNYIELDKYCLSQIV